MNAYVLVQTSVGRIVEVAEALQELEGVVVCDQVTGPYDVVVQVQVADMDELGSLVATRIQRVEGITRTVTCPVTHPHD